MSKRAGIVALLALAVVGCTSSYDTGVDEGKPFDELTPAEATTACENLVSYLEGVLPVSRQQEVSCTIRALASTTTPEACRANVTACLAGDPDTILGNLDCSSPMVSATCMATVGQVEDCVNAEMPAYLDKIDQIQCDIAGNLPELMRLQEPTPVPVECSSLSSVCPELGDGLFGR